MCVVEAVEHHQSTASDDVTGVWKTGDDKHCSTLSSGDAENEIAGGNDCECGDEESEEFGCDTGEVEFKVTADDALYVEESDEDG